MQLKEVLPPMSADTVCPSCTLQYFTREHTKPLQQYRVGCVVANLHKQVMLESCCHLAPSHAQSHSCLVSLLFIPSLHSTYFNLKNIIIFTCLPSFFLHTCAQIFTIMYSTSVYQVGCKRNQHRQHRQFLQSYYISALHHIHIQWNL